MGSKKNKKNKRNNTHKRVYVKKVPRRHKGNEEQHSEQQQQHSEEKQHDSEDEQQQSEDEQQHSDGENDLSMEGSRIINLDRLQQYSDSLSHHSSSCPGTILLSEESRYGLASVITGQCTECQHSIELETSKKVKGPKGYSR